VGGGELGSIDYLAVEFPGGRFAADDYAMLLDAVDRRAIRVLDLELVAKNDPGSVRKVELSELENPEGIDLTVCDGPESALLAEWDIAEVGYAIDPGSVVGVVIYENLWLWPFALVADLESRGARAVAHDRIPAEELVAAVDVAG
jgi:hypothetical protein